MNARTLAPSLALLVAIAAGAQELPDDLVYATHVLTEPSLAAGDSSFALYECPPFTIDDPALAAGRPALRSSDNPGTILVRRIVVAEFGADGGYLGDVLDATIEGLDGWSQSGDGVRHVEAGPALALSGASDGWLCNRSLRFPVVAGRSYVLSALLAGIDVPAGNGAGVALILERSASAPEREQEPVQEQEQEPAAPGAAPRRVLMVVANEDLYWQEYSHSREELEAAGFEIEVAAGRLERCTTHPDIPGFPGIHDPDGVMPDLALADVDSSRYAAIVFPGGWGSSMYQYGFSLDHEGNGYWNPAYDGDREVQATVNRLIGEFLAADRHVVGICHGVTILAWARVDGVSPLAGRLATTRDGAMPGMTYRGQAHDQLPTRAHLEANGATVAGSRSIGDPTTSADDVIVDGRIVTAEDFHSARACGRILAGLLSEE